MKEIDKDSKNGLRGKFQSTRVLSWVVSLMVAVGSVVVLIPRIQEPFWGHHEFNGVFYGTIAKNYVHYGLELTQGAQIVNYVEAAKEDWSLHLRHPATYPLVLASWGLLFGFSEMALRGLSVLASILGMVSLAGLNRSVFKSVWASLAVVPMLVTPLFLYYGSLPVFEPILFPIITLGLWSYWSKRERKIDLLTPLLCGLAVFVDWPGFWLGFWLLVWEIFRKKRSGVIIGIGVSLLISIAIIFGHQWLLTGSMASLGEALVDRSSFGREPFTYSEWIQTLVSRTKAFWGLPILIGVGVGFGWKLRTRDESSELLIVGLLIGLSHIFVFRTITWYHDYMLYHLLPFVGLGLGSLISVLEVKIKGWWIGLLIIVLTGTTFWMTNPFFIALSSVQPHRDCVESGLQQRGQRELRLPSRESNCGTFAGYYSLED